MTSTETLITLFDQKTARGLVDVRFATSNPDSTAIDEACRLYKAVDDNKMTALEFGDGGSAGIEGCGGLTIEGHGGE